MNLRDKLIVARTWTGSRDGGDSLAESGRIYFLSYLANQLNIDSIAPEVEQLNLDFLPPFEDVLLKLENSMGDWVRNPVDWPNHKDVSRDQLDPMIMCLSIQGLENYVASEFRKHRERFFLYPNWDLTSPEHLAHFFRYKKGIFYYLLFLLGDLFTCCNSLVLCFLTPKRVENDLNHIISLLHAESLYSTFLSRLAARIYIKWRPALRFELMPQPGDYNQVETDRWLESLESVGWRYAIRQYYNPKTGNQDLVTFYVPAMEWLTERVI